MRNKIKYISSKAEKFIPIVHRMDESLKEDAPEIKDRPLIFWVRKLTRDEQFRVRELLELKDESDPAKGIKGSGDIAKFIWENCVVSVQNVIIEEEDGNIVSFERVEGDAKNALWNTHGMDMEIQEAILFARESSVHTEVEAKN